MAAGGGTGTRSVAGFDEDTTTMAVEAARGLGPVSPDALWFSTAEPAYLDKTNANAIHAALRLDESVTALDFGGAIRSGIGALKAALDSSRTVLVVSSDMRTGLPGSADEAQGGDAAAAMLVGDGDVIAAYLGGASATKEFLERWRTPGDKRSKTWEDRFGEAMYAPLAEHAWNAALKVADITDVDVLCVAGMHARSVGRVATRLGVAKTVDLSATVGDAGTAHAMLLLAKALEEAKPDETIALVGLSDGADVLIFRAVRKAEPKRTVQQQIDAAQDVSYARFLAWRGMITPEPPNRPEPARVSAPAAERASEHKFAFDGLADATGEVVTFTVDRLAYSPSPPIVFAIVDFPDQDAPAGAPSDRRRAPLEMTDVDPERLKVGDKVEMTFRKLSTADGIHNYFWKAKPQR
jgi:3-hydroxy-3-methylglutaryl CoA synthase